MKVNYERKIVDLERRCDQLHTKNDVSLYSVCRSLNVVSDGCAMHVESILYSKELMYHIYSKVSN